MVRRGDPAGPGLDDGVGLGRRVLYLVLTSETLRTCAAVACFVLLWALIAWWAGPSPDWSRFW